MGKRRNEAGSMQDWEQPEALERLENWIGEGLTLACIAEKMGITRTTLFEWRKKSPIITASFKKGENRAVDNVENALYSAAINGNITAQIFFLKNKRPQDWKDKRDTEITGGSGKLSFEWDGKQDKKQDEDKAK